MADVVEIKRRKKKNVGFTFEDVKDRFFPSPNPHVFINRADWDPEPVNSAEEIAQISELLKLCQGSSNDRDKERHMRHIKRITEKGDEEFERRRVKDTAAGILCPQDQDPTYPTKLMSNKFVKGQCLSVEDVVLLLSNGGKRDYLIRCSDGERVDLEDSLFRGKHLVICCFFLPVVADSYQAALCHALIQAYEHSKDKFEMVVVAKVRNLYPEEELKAFNHFISGFPSLAIPFEDSYSREYWCRSLGLTGTRSTGFYSHHSRSGYFFAGIVLYPDQELLQTDLGFFYHYGASSFPFTDERLDALWRQDDEIRFRLDPLYNHPPLFVTEKHDVVVSTTLVRSVPDYDTKPVSLDQLLHCPSSHQLLNADNDEVISVSELSKRSCVALYLCLDGALFPKLIETRQQCLDQGLEFEIVLVSLFSLCDHPSSNDKLRFTLRSRNVSSCWVLPFDVEVTRRLWRLVGNSFNGDKLIFMEGNGKSWELQGKEVLYKFEMPDWHPFTRMTIGEKKLDALRSISLDALLLEPFRGAGINLIRSNECDATALSDLIGKNILVCFASLASGVAALYTYEYFIPLLLDSYKDIQASGAEVLYILLTATPNSNSEEDAPEMPWLRPPLDSPIGASAAEQLSIRCGLEPPFLLAFGKDGVMCSKHAEQHLHLQKGGTGGFPDSLFNANLLWEEIRKELYDDDLED